MPTTTTSTNQSPDCQSILYPQTSPLASHRPTRPTAVVPPLPKDPIISSPMGSITAAASMTPSSSSNYQQISPQKSSNRESNYQKQVNKNIQIDSIYQEKRKKNYIYIYIYSHTCYIFLFIVFYETVILLYRPIHYNHMNSRLKFPNQIIQTNQ
jgi:hypothetical protein